ncbi:MAG: hypothetical protein H0X65_01000 [Gemmatimonadetes bacterium]|nr:hypothetical protein [Gemmatimonadota bacterium]
MNRLLLLLLLFFLASSLSACGGDIAGGGAKEIEMYAAAHGDRTGTSGTSLQIAGSGQLTGVASVPQGMITFDAAASLFDERGEVVPITTAVTTQLQLERQDSLRFARRSVEAVEYTRLRLVFTRVEAFVDTGLIIGGVPRPGPFRVLLPTGGVTIEIPIELTVPARSPERIVVDLNATEWLVTANALGEVAPAAFQNAIRVRVW